MKQPDKVTLTLPPKSSNPAPAERPVTRLTLPTRTRHQELVSKVVDAIGAVFGDTKVSQEQTIDSLEGLQREISDRIDAIRAGLNEGGAE